MIEERRAEIERSIENLRYDREVLRELYHQVDGIVSEKNLSDIIFEIHLTELRIETLRKQLPPPMSQRQLRAIEEIPEVWAEVTGKKIGDEFLWERVDKSREEALCKAADIAAGGDLESTAKRFEEAREEHGTPKWKIEHHHSGSGDKRFEGALEDVCSVEGQYEAGRWTITPVRRGFKEWLKDWFR